MTDVTPDVLAAVREDSDLSPEEKETTLRLGKADDVATVYTAEAGIARRLLAHPHVDIDGVTVPDGDARRDVSLDEWNGSDIVGVRAGVPVGVLSVRLKPRQSTQHAEIVTDRVLETVRDTATDGGRPAPTDRDVGRALGTDPDRVRRFVKGHPNPTAEYVLGAFDGDPDHAELVADWIDAVERDRQRRRDRRQGGDDGGGQQ